LLVYLREETLVIEDVYYKKYSGEHKKVDDDTYRGDRCRRHRSYVWYLVLLLSKYQDISVKRIDLKEKPLNV